MVLSQTPKPSRKQRVFIDSSVLIAAAISSTGSARELINQGFIRLELYISSDVIEETERNLRLKAPQTLDYFYRFHKSLTTKLVKPTHAQIVRVAEIVEPKDAPIVAGAIAAKADYLVSFDRKHLLQYKKVIRESFKIKIVTPDELVK